jgi:hypothetical protein
MTCYKPEWHNPQKRNPNMLKRNLTISLLVFGLLAAFLPQAYAQGHHDVDDPFCRELQLQVQEAVGDEDAGMYRNHGEYMRAVANMVDPYVQSGEIDEECASCIVSQFARRVPIADQMPCGPEGIVKNLLGPEVDGCDGPEVGTVTFNPGMDGLDFTVEFTNGPANSTLEIYWVCTLIPNGCHGDACGYVSLGQVMTDGTGAGLFQTTLAGGNPYPGQYVHIDIEDLVNVGDWYTHLGGDEIFPDYMTTTSNRQTQSLGDPTMR